MRHDLTSRWTSSYTNLRDSISGYMIERRGAHSAILDECFKHITVSVNHSKKEKELHRFPPKKKKGKTETQKRMSVHLYWRFGATTL